jgi:putative chitinase
MSEPLKQFQLKIGAQPDGEFGKETMLKTMDHFKISKEQVVHFFAQTYHETGGFKLFSENLNYSAERLKQVFPKYFPTNLIANSYARNPEKIANRVYSDRMGNGNEASGDGYKYRGRGALQLTGKSNYKSFAEFINDSSVISNPEKVGTIYAFDSAIHFFSKNKVWASCTKIDSESILKVTRIINGGVNGLTHRSDLTKTFYSMLT